MIQWYYAHPRTREQTGPCDEAAVRAKYAAGELGGASLVWHEGLSEWIPARVAFGALPAAAPRDEAELPGGLLGWLALDGWMLAATGVFLLVLVVPAAAGLGLLAASLAVFRLRGILARAGAVRAETLPMVYAVRSVARSVGWAWILGWLTWAALQLLGTWMALDAASGGALLEAARRGVAGVFQ